MTAKPVKRGTKSRPSGTARAILPPRSMDIGGQYQEEVGILRGQQTAFAEHQLLPLADGDVGLDVAVDAVLAVEAGWHLDRKLKSVKGQVSAAGCFRLLVAQRVGVRY